MYIFIYIKLSEATYTHIYMELCIHGIVTVFYYIYNSIYIWESRILPQLPLKTLNSYKIEGKHAFLLFWTPG